MSTHSHGSGDADTSGSEKWFVLGVDVDMNRPVGRELYTDVIGPFDSKGAAEAEEAKQREAVEMAREGVSDDERTSDASA